ncbi:MAG TPA: type I restriction enzyme HsdR N-terminal domain-containing protein [Bacteroidia bacterium]|nr:type I restriction enzyme HsdR N-terminal domain-containing protein [Bacteroidia bacterium]
MNDLNLPAYPFQIRTSGQSKEIFDSLRRKYVKLTPEEWVRQHFVMYLKNELKYPSGLIAVEKSLIVNQLYKRTDIVIHSKMGKPWMIVECKAPDIVIDENTFYQAANYNHTLNVKYLVVTNGIKHFCCKFEDGNFNFIEGFPPYES